VNALTRRRLALCASMLLNCALPGATASAATSGPQLAQTVARSLVGSAAPRLALKTIDGETIDLSDLYGKKAVYLKFWATWCTPCREQMPHLEHTFESAGSDLAVIAIDVGFGDSLEAIRAYRRQSGIRMPIVFDADGHLGAAFGLRVTPQHIVIGRDGRIQYVGHLADERLDAALSAATALSTASGAAGVAGGRAPSDAPHFALGDALPPQSVSLLDGPLFKFRPTSAHRPTVLVFLSPWCESYLATTRPTVAANCRNVREQLTTRAGDQRVRCLGVASGLWAMPEDLRKYRRDYKVAIPLTLDASGTLFREFRVNDVPTVIVADGGGRIVQRFEPNDTAGVRKALDALYGAQGPVH
jgi:thiol-disulfide isomerase/thioredoxin